MHRIVMTAVALLLSAAPSLAQNADVYRAQSDTAWYRLHNPFRLYWVQGAADTVGAPSANTSVERHVWLPGSELRVEVTRYTLGLGRSVETDTISMLPTGHVIESADSTDMERTDFVLPLPRPPRPLAVGLEWTDTLIGDVKDPANPSRYRVYRHLRVERMIDSLATRLAVVTSAGRIDFGGSWWVDSVAGISRSIDATGETAETFVFDATRGRFVERTWSMHLRGSGILPGGNRGGDTVPAGLISGETLTLIPATEAEQHLRALPPGDTSYTVRGEGAMALHTIVRDEGTIRSGFSRADGMVGTAEAIYRSGALAEFAVLWTEFGEEPRLWRARPSADGLGLDVDANALEPIPEWADAWAIADYGMEELIMPAITSLPDDEQVYSLAVYRPFAGRWNEAEVAILPRLGVHIAVVRWADDASLWYFIFNPAGDLLLLEHESEHGVSQRVPALTSSLREEAERILQLLQQAGQQG